MSRTLYTEFQKSAARHADRIAIHDDDVDLTYAELEALSRRVAKSLISLGIKKGDTVAIWAVNRWQWVAAGLGLQAAGGVLIPCGTRLRGAEVAANLVRADTRFMFADPGFGSYDFVEAISEQDLPALEQIVVFDDRPRGGRAIGWEAFLALGDGVTDAELDSAIAAVGPDDLADLLFTSGTTGVPKGVPMTQEQSLVACDIQQADIAQFTPDDVFAVVFPFAHNAGYRAGWQISVLQGLKHIPVRDYDPLAVLKLIDEQKVTFLPSAPPIYQGILYHPDRDRYDLSSIRIAAVGATIVPVRLIERMQEQFGAQAVQTGYGLTEGAGSVTSTRSGTSARVIVETAGKPLSNFSIRIVDADHNALPVGETGEIAIKAPQVLHGYYKDPEATAKAFTSDGYFLTGDVGRFDSDGNLRITDRVKDMYIVGGFNAYPAEIEKFLTRMPGIAQAAVIGVDDERLGQVGKAYIIRDAGSAVTEEDVIAACKRDLANYKVPRFVEFVERLPVNAMGKVDKKVLRADA